MATLPSLFLVQFFTDASPPVLAAGYSLFTYDSGTVTPKATYTDEAQTGLNANPIILDSAGRCRLFLLTGQYTFVLKDPGGATIWTRDDVEGLPTASGTAYLPLAGGTMTGLMVLSGNATSNLNPVPLQQANALIAAAIATEVVNRNAAIAAAIPSSTGRFLRRTYYKTPGATIWTKNADMGFIDVQVVGGGASSTAAGQAGGGAGGYSRKRILAAALGSTETVTVGAGGASGGNPGVTSSFGGHCQGTGGAVGSGSVGGAGGSGSGGDVNLDGGGGGGSHGGVDFNLGGGGNSFFGGGARGSGGTGVTPGYPGGTNTGGGGGGGSAAAGGSGMIFVDEYS